MRGYVEGAAATVAWPDPKTKVWGLLVPSAATSRLAARTGLDICPEGGAALTAYETLRERGDIGPHETVVVFNTGTGLKYR